MDGYCVMVLAHCVTDVRQGFKELGINDPTRRLKFNSKENSVAVPIDVTKVQMLIGYNVVNKENCCQLIFDYLETHLPGNLLSVGNMSLPAAKKLSIKKPEVLLKDNLKDLVLKRGYSWCDEVVQEIPSHWERHGDLLLVPSASFRSPMWNELGSELWDCVTSCLSCKRVARKDVVSTDGYRTPQVHMLYGGTSWVQHTDNGIKYTYDITKCMFSSGNITEKLRVAKFDCKDEIVVDLYAGIGYFTLPYLVYTKVKHLHACEWNPDAAEALRNNLVLNAVQDRCTVHEGDNRKVCPKHIADRVNLGLIPSSRDGWPVACAALNPSRGGILHIHHNVNTKSKLCDRSLVTSQDPNDAFRCEDKVIPQEKPSLQGEFGQLVSDERNCSSQSDSVKEIDTDIGTKAVSPCHSETTKGENLITDAAYNNHSSDVIEVVRHDKNESINEHSISTKCNEDNKIRNQSDCEEKSCKAVNIPHVNDGLISSVSEVNIHSDNGQVSNDQQVSKPSVNELLSNDSQVPKHSKWLPWAEEVSKEIRATLEDLHKKEWMTWILHIEHVKSYAPYVDHVVLDLECRPVIKETIT